MVWEICLYLYRSIGYAETSNLGAWRGMERCSVSAKSKQLKQSKICWCPGFSFHKNNKIAAEETEISGCATNICKDSRVVITFNFIQRHEWHFIFSQFSKVPISLTLRGTCRCKIQQANMRKCTIIIPRKEFVYNEVNAYNNNMEYNVPEVSSKIY